MEDKKILVVDDEILLCWSLKKKLEKLGFAVATADSGEKAVEILKKQKFDALITDLRLPGIDGFSLAKSAINLSPDIKMFMISAFGDEEAKRRSETNNIKRFFDKPFDLDEFSKLVARDV